MTSAVPLARRLAAVLAAAALAAGLAACGGSDSASGTTTASQTTDSTPTTGTDASGCTYRKPAENAKRPTFDQPPSREIDPKRTYIARMETSCGTIVIRLDAKKAPNTVNNFVALARRGFFDGLTFHRVVRGFVIQGGDPNGDGTGGPGYTFPDELPTDGYQIGSLAMANSGPDTNGSQFFIVTGPAGTQLQPLYSKFGKVIKGLKVARTIEGFADPNAPPGDPSSQIPSRPLYIFKVTVTPAAG